MGADYAKRIVARLSGRPAVAATPLMAPRGIVEPKADDQGDPFDAPPIVDPGAIDAAPARADRPAARDVRAAFAPPPELLALPRASAASKADPSPPASSVITREVTTRSVIEHERVIEQVIRHRASPARSPHESRDNDRPRTEDDSDRAPAALRDARRRRDDEDLEPRRRDDRMEDARSAARSADAAPVDAARPAPARAADQRIPQQVFVRREPPAPIRRRPAPQAPSAPRVIRERPRLVIDRLVVEVVQPSAPAAPRVVTRTVASKPRPFRADGPPSITLGRASGLGQG